MLSHFVVPLQNNSHEKVHLKLRFNHVDKNTSKPLFLTSNSMSYFWDSHMYMRSKYSLHICFSWSKNVIKFNHWPVSTKYLTKEVLSFSQDSCSDYSWVKITSSNRILIPRSRSHLSPSSLKTFAWYSLQIATRSSVNYGF